MTTEAGETMKRHMAEIRRLFAAPLAARLGRDEGAVRDDGLGAADFKVDERVALTLCDGSTMSLRYAFLAVDPARRLLGVFSEHCGYYCFGFASVEVAIQYRGDVEVARVTP